MVNNKCNSSRYFFKQHIMKNIPTQLENPKGLHQRYQIRKIVNTKHGKRLVSTDEGSEYFVMRLDEGGKDPEHIKACRIGINAYANAIEHHIPQLAEDLRKRYPLL